MTQKANLKLISIFPGLVLRQELPEYFAFEGPGSALTDIRIGEARLVSLNSFLNRPDGVSEDTLELLKKVQAKIVDNTGTPISEFSLLVEHENDLSWYKRPILKNHTIVGYLYHTNYLDHTAPFDFVVVEAYQSGGHRLVARRRAQLWFPDARIVFSLPANQRHRHPLLLYSESDKLLIDTLQKVRETRNDAYWRIINALSLFNQACASLDTYPDSAVVLMVSAFESLLALPRSAKKDHFGYVLSLLWGQHQKIRGWAEKLYELRSRLVHGAVISDAELLASEYHHYPHVEIAREMFPPMLLLVLDSMGFLVVSVDFKVNALSDALNLIVSNQEKYRMILKQTSNLTYERLKTDRKLYKWLILMIEGLTLTDDSGRKLEGNVLRLVYDIATAWINADLQLFRSQEGKPGYGWVKNHVTLLSEVSSLLVELQKMNWPPRDRLAYTRKWIEFQEAITKLEPIVHAGEKFHFTVAEFLDRCTQHVGAH
ncbi:MAG: hypothetical protein KAT58_07730 [candidate division Zixibacteria bacterium]|nr:hypothetical protein [candidate division Zixibacteria bacterium]